MTRAPAGTRAFLRLGLMLVVSSAAVAAGERAADGLAAAPASPAAKARGLIELAIRRGVPMYNRGDHAGCAAVYEVAAHALVAMSADMVSPEAWSRMEEGIRKLDSEHHAGRRAWALRHMLDDAYRSLEAASAGAPTSR